MDAERLFTEFLRAESEDEVLKILQAWHLLDDPEVWQPLGGEENNFAIVGNQHADPTGALVEKIINAIDARLMAACYAAEIDPEGNAAPSTMVAAIERFFGIRGGRLGDLVDKELRELAAGIELVAVGRKNDPCYLIVDVGEGQTPDSFPDTFLSLAKSNKLRIPFVQGKFNAGGTGVLQFCGTENLQLIASRRNPEAPHQPNDETANQWGFTLVRRVEPSKGRRSSMYVYLAPEGRVPTFSAPGIDVLPGDSRQNQPGKPYSRSLEHGTAIKLYNYRWKARSIATTDARFELERYLHSPCLPFRVTETRPYRANYYSTSVAGVWAAIEADEGATSRKRVEDGFPAAASLTLPSTGRLDYKIVVFKEDMQARRIPRGVVFTINGQVHGELPPDFISRRLKFEYLRSHLLVSVDCAGMRARIREDFFPGARDRVRRNETYEAVVSGLEEALKDHPGLRELNAARRARKLEKALSSEEDVVQTLNDLLNADPALRALFQLGDRLVTSVGPADTEHFDGRRFPTYFRLRDGGERRLVKHCPINRACKVFYETDAMNDYFDRDQSPGRIDIDTQATVEYQQLWNGVYTVRFRPSGAAPGDEVDTAVTVIDDEREAQGKPPFESAFSIKVDKADVRKAPPGGKTRKKKPKQSKSKAPRLALPQIGTIRRDEWGEFDPPFTEDDALRVVEDGKGGFDYIVNLDNRYLLTQLAKSKAGDRDLVVHWFKYGLAIGAMGMIQHGSSGNGAEGSNSTAGDNVLDVVNRSANGLASVIVPIIRTLHRGPVPD